MPRAREWADEFEQGIKAYGINEDQIQRYSDSDIHTMIRAVFNGDNSARAKIEQNSRQGRKTLLLCFYAGRGVTFEYSTRALLNTNQREGMRYQCALEHYLSECAKEKGAYVISLLACDRIVMPEEAQRGGTEAIEDPGQSITIHAAFDGWNIYRETTSLAQEFLQ